MATDKIEQEEPPIDRKIVDELINTTPDTWNSIFLAVDYSAEDGGYAFQISSPEGHPEYIVPSETIVFEIFNLGQLYQQSGQHWKRVTYTVQHEQDDTWNYTAKFEY